MHVPATNLARYKLYPRGTIKSRPAEELLGIDAVLIQPYADTYALSVTLQRRMLTQGRRAMITANITQQLWFHPSYGGCSGGDKSAGDRASGDTAQMGARSGGRGDRGRHA